MTKIFQLLVPTSGVTTYYVRDVDTEEEAKDLLLAGLASGCLLDFPDIALASVSTEQTTHPKDTVVERVSKGKARAIEAYYFVPSLDYDIEDEFDDMSVEQLTEALANFSTPFSIEVEDEGYD